MVVFLCFGSYILQSNLISRQKQAENYNEAAIRKSLEIVNGDNYNRPMRLQVIICHKKRSPFFAFFYKTRANTQ